MSSSFRMGVDEHCASVSDLWAEERHNLAANVEGALQCPLWFLHWSEVTKELNFILATGALAVVAKWKT